MSGVVRLSSPATPRRTASSLQPSRPAHAVQFYDDEAFLYETVARFLGPGLRGDDRILIVATEAHRQGIARHLEPALVEDAKASGRLLFLDARETLSRFMVGDLPDPDLFREVLDSVLSQMRGDHRRKTHVRVYGEMVDVLWKDGNAGAAVRLEELWNDAAKDHSFALLCAYVMGNFYREAASGQFMEICRNHSHVLPDEAFASLGDADVRLREIALLQQRARSLESEIHHREELEGALREALRERGRVEEELRESVRREREAREQAEASDAFKEVFLGILGHDLRNPLNTVLTTARLMAMRGELAPESHKRLERVVASGERMQRMIEQLLDLTSARLAGGIPIERNDERELAPLVEKIVDEVRAANPGRAIELLTQGTCRAHVDGDRFEQVVSNLVANAVLHGDPGQPVRVELATRAAAASLSVHNQGVPIDPALLPTLFDPFKRGETRAGRPHGLGLGLYIADRIVTAHGGTLRVESTVEQGTRFEALFPIGPCPAS
jgi:signal transduction histidine kinase